MFALDGKAIEIQRILVHILGYFLAVWQVLFLSMPPSFVRPRRANFNLEPLFIHWTHSNCKNSLSYTNMVLTQFSRMQCETVSGGLHGNRLIWATAHKMFAKEGIRAFYRGLIPGLIGMAPYAALDLGTFEYLKTYVTKQNIAKGMHEYDAKPSSLMTAAMGGFTGAMGATIVYPVNLVRTRLQTQGTILHPRTYKGFWDATMITVRGEGIGGLFKGIAPNLVKVVPAVSIVSLPSPFSCSECMVNTVQDVCGLRKVQKGVASQVESLFLIVCMLLRLAIIWCIYGV